MTEGVDPEAVDTMERHGHLDLDPLVLVKAKLLEVSAASIDCLLATARLPIDGQFKHRKGVGSAIRRSIPMRIFADSRPRPRVSSRSAGVEHGGSKTDSEFVHALTLTNISIGWAENVAIRTRNQVLVDRSV